MARFVYTAEKVGGEVYKGTAEAADRFELYQVVRREGGRIISLEEKASSKYLDMRWWNAKLARVKEYEKILFARNLGAMLSAGLPLARALAVIERQTKNLKLAEVVAALSSDVRRGDTLHVALEKYPGIFSKLFTAMIRAGEEGGDLPQSLIIVSDQMDRMFALKKKIRGALIYPCVVLFAIVAIGAVMMVKVVPTLAQTFKEMNAQLPAATTAVIAFSDFLQEHGLIALMIFVTVVGSIYGILRTRQGQRGKDWVLLHLPLISPLVREVNAARTSRTLASLLGSGVDVLTSLQIVSEVVQNSYFQEVIRASAKAVGQGEPLSVSFTRREDLYPAFVGEMMSVGEETGKTNEMLKSLAVYYEEEVDRKTKDMATIIEPFLMLIIGVAVGFFAVAMISPIYSMSSHI